MSMNRRQFIQLMAIASAGSLLQKSPLAAIPIPTYGQVRLLHITDCHAQLLPIYYREPHINLGMGQAQGKVPHLVGSKLLDYFGIQPNTIEAHAFTHLNYLESAQKYGKVGGFAHLATIIVK